MSLDDPLGVVVITVDSQFRQQIPRGSGIVASDFARWDAARLGKRKLPDPRFGDEDQWIMHFAEHAAPTDWRQSWGDRVRIAAAKHVAGDADGVIAPLGHLIIVGTWVPDMWFRAVQVTHYREAAEEWLGHRNVIGDALSSDMVSDD